MDSLNCPGRTSAVEAVSSGASFLSGRCESICRGHSRHTVRPSLWVLWVFPFIFCAAPILSPASNFVSLRSDAKKDNPASHNSYLDCFKADTRRRQPTFKQSAHRLTAWSMASNVCMSFCASNVKGYAEMNQLTKTQYRERSAKRHLVNTSSKATLSGSLKYLCMKTKEEKKSKRQKSNHWNTKCIYASAKHAQGKSDRRATVCLPAAASTCTERPPSLPSSTRRGESSIRISGAYGQCKRICRHTNIISNVQWYKERELKCIH